MGDEDVECDRSAGTEREEQAPGAHRAHVPPLQSVCEREQAAARRAPRLPRDIAASTIGVRGLFAVIPGAACVSEECGCRDNQRVRLGIAARFGYDVQADRENGELRVVLESRGAIRST